MKSFFPANHRSYLLYFHDWSIEQSSNSWIYRLHESDFEQNTLINGMTLFFPNNSIAFVFQRSLKENKGKSSISTAYLTNQYSSPQSPLMMIRFWIPPMMLSDPSAHTACVYSSPIVLVKCRTWKRHLCRPERTSRESEYKILYFHRVCLAIIYVWLLKWKVRHSLASTKIFAQYCILLRFWNIKTLQTVKIWALGDLHLVTKKFKLRKWNRELKKRLPVSFFLNSDLYVNFNICFKP